MRRRDRARAAAGGALVSSVRTLRSTRSCANSLFAWRLVRCCCVYPSAARSLHGGIFLFRPSYGLCCPPPAGQPSLSLCMRGCSGMERIKEVKNPILGVGQKVDVVFGEPIQMDDLLRRCVPHGEVVGESELVARPVSLTGTAEGLARRCKTCKEHSEREQLWKQITERIRGSMEGLRDEMDHIEALQPSKMQGSGPEHT